MAVIKPKRSGTASSTPTTSDLADGEFAVNSADQKIYIRSGTSVVEVGNVFSASEAETLTNKVVFGKLSGISNQGATKTITVTVATKTSNHPNSGGSSSAYFLDGVEAPLLKLTKGTYKFDQADSSNSTHPLRFYLDDAKGTAYTTGVTTNGTAGSSGAYTQIVVDDTTPFTLSYQCSSHGFMGSYVHVSGTTTILGQTIDSDSNTITNIVNADIKSSAAIALSKLATTTASRALVSSGTGAISASDVTSTELSLLDGSTAGSVVNSKAVIYSGTGTIAGTLSTAAQTNITSLGTLGSLTVDNVAIDGATIGHTDDTDLMTLADGVVTVAGELSATTLDIGGTNITATAAEINLIDGGTARGTTAVASGDGVLINDAGTMRMTNVDTLSTYLDSISVGGSNIVTTGALNSGSITSGFGNINNGSSTITTTGLISGGSLDIDDVVVNGSTIGHTDDTDLITVADGIVTVAGELSATTLDIGGTNITSTAAELNLLDGSSAGTVVNSKGVIYSGTGTIAGTLSTAAQGNITSLGTLTTLTVDNIIINGTTIGHTSDTDAISIDSSGNVTISQNLTVSGTTTTQDTQNLTVSANLIEVNTGLTGTNSNDSGLVIERGSTGDNAIIAWDESEDKFIVGTTTATSTSTGNLTITTGTLVANLEGNVTGTLQTAAQGNITSLGTLTTLTVDNVIVNGTTIGHTDDTDLMTLADGVVTVAGELSATTLDIGGTNITATAAEINLIDGGTARGTTAIADGDGVLINDAGTMRMTTVETLAAYLDDEITAMPNLTSVGTLTTLTVDNVIINGTNIGHTSDTDAMAIAADGVVTFSQPPVLGIGGIDIDGAGSSVTTLADADLFIVDDGGGGTNKKVAASVIKTYAGGGVTVIDESTTLTTSLSQLTFTGSGVAATEPGSDGLITVTVEDESLINAIIFG